MEPKTITATELARNLSDVLNRVKYRGEVYVIERNGEPVATLEPPAQPAKVRTWKELLELWAALPRWDDKFADDIEWAIKNQPGMPDIP